MRVVVGLGNIGPKYVKTRHNIGFIAVDELARRLDGSNWKPDATLKADISEASTEDEKIVLAKPTTFMNMSGEAVQRIMQKYRLRPDQVIVVHDDIDLDEGDIKIKRGGSGGGQKGIESIIEAIGEEFWRVRIGIGRNDRSTTPSEVYVMQPLPDEATQALQVKQDLYDQILTATK